ncbi:protein NDRG4 isoform X3 [Crotalus tigris]|uniref:protein NDRG4 isoform X3 n=1 Tax=Crotalus tigris TaxID=88082 RepID=UPI00192F40EA|nr:protein NDRG4 isoform X3 [Crotalus tigris]
MGFEAFLDFGSKLEIPLWLAKGLYDKRRIISVELPKVYKESWRTVFNADASVVDLHKLGPYYYGFGSQLLNFDNPENTELAQSILQTFIGRFRHIMDSSQNTFNEDTSALVARLDELERALFQTGQKGLHDFQCWEMGLLLQEVTMASLHEQRFTEEKPLLRGQDAEMENSDTFLPAVDIDWKEHDIETPYGLLHVVLRGSARGNRPALLTYHDVGLNHKLCFNTLFNSEEMLEIMKHFVVCHVDAPGQQTGASQFPQGYQYPSMDQLAAMLPSVVQHFGFKYVIGIGVGAGAYVLTKFALIFPDLVEGLVLINIDPNGKGWIDWAASKLSGLTSTLSDMVLSHLFSQEELANNMELVQSYRQQIASTVNQFNLQLFWSMYNSRRDLEINRPGSAPNAKTLRCPVMLVVGDNAPAEDGVVECNSRLDPTTTTFLKMADSGGLPQVTQPGKLTEAFKYFLQGMGYVAYLKDRRLSGGTVPSASMTRLARSRTASLTSASSVDGNRPRACTHSESSEAMGQINHTMEVSC